MISASKIKPNLSQFKKKQTNKHIISILKWLPSFINFSGQQFVCCSSDWCSWVITENKMWQRLQKQTRDSFVASEIRGPICIWNYVAYMEIVSPCCLVTYRTNITFSLFIRCAARFVTHTAKVSSEILTHRYWGRPERRTRRANDHIQVSLMSTCALGVRYIYALCPILYLVCMNTWAEFRRD